MTLIRRRSKEQTPIQTQIERADPNTGDNLTHTHTKDYLDQTQIERADPNTGDNLTHTHTKDYLDQTQIERADPNTGDNLTNKGLPRSDADRESGPQNRSLCNIMMSVICVSVIVLYTMVYISARSLCNIMMSVICVSVIVLYTMVYISARSLCNIMMSVICVSVIVLYSMVYISARCQRRLVTPEPARHGTARHARQGDPPDCLSCRVQYSPTLPCCPRVLASSLPQPPLPPPPRSCRAKLVSDQPPVLFQCFERAPAKRKRELTDQSGVTRG
ncbi:hypothetical protein RRG08_038310 [Elysia crispata]|uniref:Uncharacterized protein n=1 Tax=Elysia crispata TaxID=231223 RepID=A0AAE1AN62_9GAST|nr:hypothetical protein RRG08_038310 [Elysia crispata]